MLAPLKAAAAPTIPPEQSPAAAPAPEHEGTDRPKVRIAYGIPATAPAAAPTAAPVAPPTMPKTITLQERLAPIQSTSLLESVVSMVLMPSGLQFQPALLAE